jgi:hypothetical protein
VVYTAAAIADTQVYTAGGACQAAPRVMYVTARGGDRATPGCYAYYIKANTTTREGTTMARTKVQTTGNTPFTGTQYTEFLSTRLAAMKGHAEGTVDTATKNAARAVVRQARKVIAGTGMTVEEWRTVEETREAELAATRVHKPRQPKADPVPEVTE